MFNKSLFSETDVEATSVKVNSTLDITGAEIIGLDALCDNITIEYTNNLHVIPSGISSISLADNSVTTPKIADANVTDAKIASVSAAKITGTITNDVNNSNTTTTALTVNGNIVVTGNVDGVDVSAFKADYDSKVNQDVRTTASPTFVTVNANLNGNASTVTNGVYTTDTGTVTNTMLAGSISDTKLSTISTAGKVSNSATTATSSNTASAIVARDGSGNFSAGTVTASLSGNSSTATALQNARTIGGVSFDGTANIVPQTIQTVDESSDTTNYLLFSNTSGSGNIQPKNNFYLSYNASTAMLTASQITASSGTIIGTSTTCTTVPALSGDVSTTGSTNVTTIGAGKVTNSMLAGSIDDSKLNTISTASKVSNSATTATSSNTASAIVARDGSGNFSAGTVTANLSGNVTGAVTGNSSTATALQNARTIGGVSFDGTANIVPQTIQTVDESSDTTCYLLLANTFGTTNQQPKTNIYLSYNASTAMLTASQITASSGTIIGTSTTCTTVPALSGDVSTNGSNNVTTIGAGVVTNSMLSGSIASSKLVGTDIGTVGTISTGTWNGSKVSEVYGGTNQNTYAQGDILYASAANTLSKLAKNSSSTRYLSNTGTSNNPAWAQIDGSNGISGTISNDVNATNVTATNLTCTNVTSATIMNRLLPIFQNLTGSLGDIGTITATTTNPTYNTPTVKSIYGYRSGNYVHLNYQWTAVGTGAGSGNYLIPLPSGYDFSSAVTLNATASTTQSETALQPSVIGYGHISNSGGSRGACICYAYSTTRFRIGVDVAFSAQDMWSNGRYTLASGTTSFGVWICYPVNGFSATQTFSSFST